MKFFCRFFALALILGMTGLANAGTLDFKMNVLDGPITGDYIEGTAPFAVSFGACPLNLTNAGALGCFDGYNDTSYTLTSLNLTFTNTTSSTSPNDFFNYLNGQTPDCAATAVFDVVSTCYLSTDKTTYVLDFSGGTGIPAATTFFIAEYGVNPNAFQGGMGQVTLSPEPSSILLLGTGVLMVGMLLARRRMASPFSGQ